MTELVRLSSLQRRVVAALLTYGPLARAELTERLDVSRSRLSPEVGGMITKKVVREEESMESTGGRRATKLVLGDRGFGLVAGVDIDAGGVSMVLMQLDGTVVSRRVVDCSAPADPQPALSAIDAALKRETAKARSPLRMIGVSIAADIDNGGYVSEPPPTMPAWAGVSIAEHFQKCFGVPTFVENDVNVLAIAERARGGPASGLCNYAVVKVSSGVGCGLVVNERLVRGSDGFAGDIGHVTIDAGSTAICACGNTGCLEASVSAPALVREAEALAASGKSPALAELKAKGPLSMQAIGQAAELEDPAATALLRAAGLDVGYAIAGLVTILNPAAVFISTGIRGAENVVLSAIRQRVYEHARPAATKGLTIGTCQLGREDGAVGAAEFACHALVAG
ncbi:ROK family transcriptional regulator [Mycobacterium sp. 236(2023)]|uniref:ROK family transcriptional regulator n=1 Tax=Mycobacterium sp. 236(2023) TaxID=3038163 RepID=UPI0024154F65|nr:ROK family transcriptional regulator [Mycobacterium sp. 236(2023)]MDG4663691.1 ROK family transcriptional regulator [Mycobacterium sp. 236(2023)]